MKKKNNKTIEMCIYEMLGIKQFRKVAFFFHKKICALFKLRMSKEEREKQLNEVGDNYNIGKIKGVEDLKNFKIALYLNTIIHVIALLILLPIIINIFSGKESVFSSIVCTGFFVENIYCIMLQRYNYIRLNHAIKKMEKRDEKRKEIALSKEKTLKYDEVIVKIDNKELNIDNKIIKDFNQYQNYYTNPVLDDNKLSSNKTKVLKLKKE